MSNININKPFISVGIDVGADISFMSIALPNQLIVGKPFKITHSNLPSLEKAVSAIKEAETVFLRKSYLSGIHRGLSLPALLLSS